MQLVKKLHNFSFVSSLLLVLRNWRRLPYGLLNVPALESEPVLACRIWTLVPSSKSCVQKQKTSPFLHLLSVVRIYNLLGDDWTSENLVSGRGFCPQFFAETFNSYIVKKFEINEVWYGTVLWLTSLYSQIKSLWSWVKPFSLQ